MKSCRVRFAALGYPVWDPTEITVAEHISQSMMHIERPVALGLDRLGWVEPEQGPVTMYKREAAIARERLALGPDLLQWVRPAHSNDYHDEG